MTAKSRVRRAARLLGAACLALAATAAAEATPDRVYELDYEARLRPQDGVVDVSLALRQPRDLMRELSFEFDPERYNGFAADGELEVGADRLTWHPPAAGGRLSFTLRLDHRRGKGGYDSHMQPDWAVFRADDLLPPAATRTLKGARSEARLRLTGPADWSFISAYERSDENPEWFLIERSGRRFDRPVGWMAAGRLGVRWETIADRKVAIAGPLDHGVRRLDMLAFLHWNLPELVLLYPDFPARLLIVSAGDPMWRGGLSGPASLFIHAERPLLSANGTSTLLHELLHVAQGYRAERDEDWIVEGMAEYYTLEIMRRSGTLSAPRQERGLEKLEEWAQASKGLLGDRSTGARTARGVTVMHALDRELRRRSKGRYSLDDVARALAESGEPVSLQRLRELAEPLAGGPLKALSEERLLQKP